MSRETITDKQGISTLVLFICGSTLIFDTAISGKEDIWLAIIIAFICAFIMVMLYARVLALFPGNDIFDILIVVFGKIIGRILCLFYVFFAIHLASLVLYNFEEFITVAALSATPALVPITIASLLILWIMKSGAGVLGAWSEIFAVIIFVLIFFTIPFFIPIAKLENLKPFLYQGIRPVINAALQTFSFPFTETIVFMGLGNVLISKKSPYKVYGWGILFGALIIFCSTVIHAMVIGPENMSRTIFPSHRAYKIINIREFFTRIEIIIAASLIFGGFVKITICLITTCRGICKVFSVDNYKIIITPVCIINTVMSTTNFTGVLEWREWINSIWIWHATTYEVILFVVVLAGAEIKSRKLKRS